MFVSFCKVQKRLSFHFFLIINIQQRLFKNINMTKSKKQDISWKPLLEKYASWEVKSFKAGQQPRKGTWAYTEKEKIEKCAIFQVNGKLDSCWSFQTHMLHLMTLMIYCSITGKVLSIQRPIWKCTEVFMQLPYKAM
jgi:hypothetical protein